MDCCTFLQLLERDRDERLPALVGLAFDAHSRSCAECARQARLDAELREALRCVRREDELVEMPDDFARRVKERIIATPPARRPSLGLGTRAALVAAGLIVAAVGLAAVVERQELSTGSPVRLADGRTSSQLPSERAEPSTVRPVSHVSGATSDARDAPLLFASPDVEVVLLSGGDSPRTAREGASEVRRRRGTDF